MVKGKQNAAYQTNHKKRRRQNCADIFAYYGVTDNSKSLQSFAYWVTKTLYKWLNRRGKRGCYTWEKFTKLLKLYPLPNPRITVNLLSTSR